MSRPTYQALFGSTAYYTVDPARSILSPAAYFVALMKLKESDIIENNPDFSLKSRRPDLWGIPLDGANTDTLVSKLKIVNQILSNYVGGENSLASEYPFNLPYDEPLTRIRKYLAQNGSSLQQIWKDLTPDAGSVPTTAMARETLALPQAQWALYSTPDTGADLCKYFGAGFLTPSPGNTAALISALTPVDIFINQTGLDYDQLNELLFQDLSDDEITRGLNAAFFINAGAPSPLAVQNGSLTSLTATALDQIHRFVRLAQALNWSFADLDWALRTIGYGTPTLNGDNALPYLAWMQTQTKEDGFSIDQACACLGKLKDFGKKDGLSFFEKVFKDSFDRVFNSPADANNLASFYSYTLTWQVPTPGETTDTYPNPQIKNALAAALQLSQDDLLVIANLMLKATSADTASLPLTAQNLGILYRLSLFPILTGLSVKDSLLAASLSGVTQSDLASSQIATTLGALTRLMDFCTWLERCPLPLHKLQFVLTGTSDDLTIQNKILGVDAVTNFLQDLTNSLKDTRMTEANFFQAIKTELQQTLSKLAAGKRSSQGEATLPSDLGVQFAMEISHAIFSALTTSQYIDASGIVSISDATGLNNICQSINQSLYSALYAVDFSTWSQGALPQGVINCSCSFNNTLYLGTEAGAVYSSNDHGNSWNLLNPNYGTSNKNGFLCGFNGVLYQWTTNNQLYAYDGGWTPISNPPSGIVTCSCSFNDTLYVGLQTGGIYSSNDGKTWAPLPSGIGADNAVHFLYGFNTVLYAWTDSGLYSIDVSQAQPSWTAQTASLYATVLSTLINAHHLQHNAFIARLAALYGVSQSIGVVLKDWGELNIESLLGSSSPSSLLNAVLVTEAAPLLQKLQQAAELITGLSLSTAEAEYFKTDFTPTATYPITLAAVQVECQFKELVESFQDTQNNLLTLVEGASAASPIDTSALAKLSGWSEEQVNFLNPSPVTIGDVALLRRYFDTAKLLGQSVNDVYQLNQLSVPGSTVDESSCANALWGGLQAKFSEQPTVLGKIENSLREALRDRLVGLAMHQLGVNTSRALYEYFLIDVEVGGSVETSTIREATAAIQLYIYRCLNRLEEDVTVNPGLADLWSWMYAYREWQANMEVFLYPEDYIQPELRKNKTDLFAKLESDLKQVDLSNPGNVDAVFREYMNGLAEIGSLSIVGSAIRNFYLNNTAAQELCLVGKTRHQPSHYYYRIATFAQDRPSDWGQWKKIDIQIHPVHFQANGAGLESTGAVSPTFAFGTWYLFWVEQRKTGGSTNVTYNSNNQPAGNQNVPEYTTSIQYTHLDFGKRWVPAQMLAPKDDTSGAIESEAGSSPVFAPRFDMERSIESFQISCLCSFNGDLYACDGHGLFRSPDGSIWSQVSPLQQANSIHLSNVLALCSFNGALYACDGNGLYSSADGGTWNEVPQPQQANSISLGQIRTLCDFNGTLYASDGNGLFSSTDGYTWLQVPQPQQTASSIDLRDIRILCVFNDALYTSGGNGLFISTDGSNWSQVPQPQSQPNQATINLARILTLCAFNGALYACDGNNLFSSADGLNWTEIPWITQTGTPLALINFSSIRTLCSFNGYLYACDGNSFYRTADGSANGSTWNQFITGMAAKAICNLNGNLYICGGDGLLYRSIEGLFFGGVGGSVPFTGNVSPNFAAAKAFCSFNGNLWLCDGSGIYISSDGSSWQQQASSALNPSSIQGFCSFNGTLYAYGGGFYSYADSGTWSNVTVSAGSLDVNSIQILFSFNGALYACDGNGCSCSMDRTTWFLLPEPPPLISIHFNFNNNLFFLSGALTRVIYRNELLVWRSTDHPNAPLLLTRNVAVLSQNETMVYSVVTDNAGKESIALSSNGAQITYYLNSLAIEKLSTLLHRPEGVDALLATAAQQDLSSSDFTMQSAMCVYYWELFFHVPFLIANELHIQQHFKHARKWYNYIFNPAIDLQHWYITAGEAANDKYWRFLGLRSAYNSALQTELSESPTAELEQDLQNPYEMYEFYADPFDPHAIARLRPIAYQKSMLSHYIDNLLAWGDMLFRENSRESIGEAEMFYVMAYDLLGETPQNLGPMPLPTTGSYQSGIGSNYFGIPRNRQFLAYWDEVKQRLYDIRHSLTITGQKDILPLFQPPINPMQLVEAIGSGEGVGQAIESLNSTVPYYRFVVMIEKAKAATQSTIALGQSLLSALEQKDAQQLAVLYNTNQQHILHLSRISKEDQLKAAKHNLQALQLSLANAQARQTHYTMLINAGLSASEQKQLSLAQDAIGIQAGTEAIKIASIPAYLAPNIFGFSDGGMKFGDAVNQGAGILEGAGNLLNMGSGIAGTLAGYQRRAQDWQLQATLAQDDINQIQYQILAAQYQQHLAEQEIALLEKNLSQETAIATFYHKKFTNSQLYHWYIGKVSDLYFQTYQLAHDIALQAENAWKFEQIGLGKTDSARFIVPGNWNSLRQGLLAGEALQLNLQRMEKAFLDQNERCLEITKTISLAQLDPTALLGLKMTGSCSFDITEKDFDFDFPGHYCRKIKSVAISLPAVLGPYQNIHATLTQTGNKVVASDGVSGIAAAKYLLTGQAGSGDGLKIDLRPNQQVALSQGINDTGLFELNFNDERYLPFEGTGAVSSWKLEIPFDDNALDHDSLTDVIIELKYTALAGSAAFKQAIVDARGCYSGYRIYSLAQEFSTAWQGFANQITPQALVFTVKPAQWRRNTSSFTVSGLSLYAITDDGTTAPAFTLQVNSTSVEFLATANNSNPSVGTPLPSNIANITQSWTLEYLNGTAVEQALPPGIKNLFLIVEYSAAS